MGAFFGVLYIAAIIAAALYLFSLLNRLVRAHEKAAFALEKIAHRIKHDPSA